MFKKIVKYFSITFAIFVFRYLFSILISYLLPSLHWTDYTFEKKFLLPPFLFQESPKTDLVGLWLHWDSNFYLKIAQKGYEINPFNTSTLHDWAFYPLYPLLIRFISQLFGFLENKHLVFVTGIFLSNIFFAFGLLYLRKLLFSLNIDREKVNFISLLFIIFPSSYFFQLFYPESLFFFLTVIFFNFLFSKKYQKAAFILGLNLITKIQGIILIPVFFIYFFSQKFKKINFKNILDTIIFTALILFPIGLFFFYLKMITGDFFCCFKNSNRLGQSIFLSFICSYYLYKSLRIYNSTTAYSFFNSNICSFYHCRGKFFEN